MELNTELLTRISDWLKAGAPETGQGFGFDMNTWIEAEALGDDNWCGTACCIAGAALVFGDNEAVVTTLDAHSRGYGAGQFIHWYNIDTLAAEALGLNSYQAQRLFEPWSFFDIPDHITPAQAAATIDRLIETGDVVWA